MSRKEMNCQMEMPHTALMPENVLRPTREQVAEDISKIASGTPERHLQTAAFADYVASIVTASELPKTTEPVNGGDALERKSKRTFLGQIATATAAAMSVYLAMAPPSSVKADHMPEKPTPHRAVKTSANSVPSFAVSPAVAKYQGSETWVASAIDGYWIDYYKPYTVRGGSQGDTFTKLKIGWSKGIKYAYGEVKHHYVDGTSESTCGWIKDTAEVQTIPISTSSNEPCRQKMMTLFLDRKTFGNRFNCAAHACVDGTVKNGGTPLNKDCDHNFYRLRPKKAIVTLPNGETKLMEINPPVGKVKGPVHYRYTENNGKWAVVRTKMFGWGRLAWNCVKGQLITGGTPK